MVELVPSEGCEPFVQSGALNSDDPQGAFAGDTCDFEATNTNSASFSLQSDEQFRWRVRRVLEDAPGSAAFGDWTSFAIFRTAGLVTETPVFVDPVGTNGDYPTAQSPVLNLGVASSSTIHVAWRPTGCPPYRFESVLIDSEGTDTLTASPQACVPPPGEPELCQMTVSVDAGESYQLLLTHIAGGGSLGEVETSLSFSVAGN
jgi:hypothetical protein